LPKIRVQDVLDQIERIPSEWLNSVGKEVISAIETVCSYLETNGVSEKTLENILQKEKYSLDVMRLMLGLSQDEFLNELLYFAKIPLGTSFETARRRTPRFAKEIASTLVNDMGIKNIANFELFRKWKYHEVLVERYKFMRGRAVKGQKRGRSLEDDVQELLDELGLSYVRGGNFTTSKGSAKADFSIPSSSNPSVIIEVKGYEATGSKLTDVLGDILKILQAKEDWQKFYFVTDGIGWFRRVSDLEHVVELCNQGKVEMIFTRKTLDELKEALKVFRDDVDNVDFDS